MHALHAFLSPSDLPEVFPYSFLCNEDETPKAWKPLLNTLFAFRGSSECLHKGIGKTSGKSDDFTIIHADRTTTSTSYISAG